MPCQSFGKSPTSVDMARLSEAWPDRTFVVGSRKVTFVLCGEINGFDLDGRVKHDQLPFVPDILANPAHTIMGHWNHLGKKLSGLSSGGRVAIHATNNNHNRDALTTDVRIYIDEKLQGATQFAGKLKWCECEL